MRNPMRSAVLALAMLLPIPVPAAVIFVAHLTTDQEPSIAGPTTDAGAPRPIPFGEGVFVLNDAEDELSMDVTVFNIDVTGTQTPDLNDNLRAAHIHILANATDATGPVRWGFFGTPFNDTLPPSIVVTPFATGVGGRFTSVWNAPEGNAGFTLTALLPAILDERAYVNFHTVQNPAGEIRGQLLVPEPGTIALLMIGAWLAACARPLAARLASTA